MSRLKFTTEQKIEIIKAFKSGKVCYSQLQEVYGVYPDTIYKWISRYEKHGIGAFARGTGNSCYSKEFKKKCVEAYLRGEGGLRLSAVCMRTEWLVASLPNVTMNRLVDTSWNCKWQR